MTVDRASKALTLIYNRLLEHKIDGYEQGKNVREVSRVHITRLQGTNDEVNEEEEEE